MGQMLFELTHFFGVSLPVSKAQVRLFTLRLRRVCFQWLEASAFPAGGLVPASEGCDGLLQAPTGSGKTYAAMGHVFAHAVHQGKRRAGSSSFGLRH